MENKKSKNILETRERLINFINQYQKTIEDVRKMKGEHKLGNRKYLNDCITEYKKNIKSLREQINMCNQILKENSTFPANMLIHFIKECISVYEQTPYTNTTVAFTESINVAGNYNAQINLKYMIFDSVYEEQEKILEETFLVRGLSYFYTDLLKDSRYIIGDYKNELTLIDEKGLNTDFLRFPYLEEIAYNLIDSRLKNPEKDLQSVLDNELEYIKCFGKSKKKQHND